MLNRDFAEMLVALSAERVQFLVVGAYAMAAHGLPRATGDIDIWVRPSQVNARRVLRALDRFGAPRFDLTLADLSREGTVFQLGLPPRRIDILTSIDGIEFATAWKTRTVGVVEHVTIPILDRAALIRNKRAAGRPKDLLDVQILEATAPPAAPPSRTRRVPKPRRRSRGA